MSRKAREYVISTRILLIIYEMNFWWRVYKYLKKKIDKYKSYKFKKVDNFSLT